MDTRFPDITVTLASGEALTVEEFLARKGKDARERAEAIFSSGSAAPSGDEEPEAAPKSGFEKIPRGRKNREEAPQPRTDRSRHPRRQRKPADQGAPPATLNSPKTPKIQKEVTEMTQEQGQPQNIQTRREERHPCPLCGYDRAVNSKTEQPFLICKGCSDRYNQYRSKGAAASADAIMKGEVEAEPVKSRIEWVYDQLDLERFQAELDQARTDHEAKEQEAQILLQAKKGDRWVDPAVMRELRNRCRLEVGANRTFGAMKRMEGRLETARALKPELEARIAEEAAKAAEQPTETSAETSAPEQPAAPETTIPDYESRRVTGLREELRSRGLPTSGKRDELVARLREADASDQADSGDR